MSENLARKDWLPFDEFYEKKMSKRPVGSAMFFRNEHGEILMLKSTYRDGWVLPGGLSDGDESPKETAYRETFEEIGLKVEPKRLLTVEHNIMQNGKASMVFVFDGGVLSSAQIQNISLDTNEASDFAFVAFEEAVQRATNRYKDRVKYAMKSFDTGCAYYFEKQYTEWD